MNQSHAGLRTWVEVDTKALKNNYDVFRKIIGAKVKLMAVAKSNAYGHCLYDYAKVMAGLGVDWLGVDSVTEAMKLRREGIKTPILILGHTLTERLKDCLENDLTVTVSSFEQIKELDSRLRGNDKEENGNDKEENGNDTLKLRAHIKIDTGMHRQGFQTEEVEDACQQIRQLENIKVEGIFTHFAAAKNPAFPADTKAQIEQFKTACDIAKRYFGENLIKHAAATAGTLLFPESHFDMVRIGIGLYGLWTSKEAKALCGGKIELMPALSWRTVVAEVKIIKAGERISYDLTEKFEKEICIAVLPIGYWNGFRRSLSSIGHVLIQGKRAKVLGRVTMDMIMVDVTEIPAVHSGDIVTLIGRDSGQEITADEIALLTETSNYEVVTQLNPLMKRVYLD